MEHATAEELIAYCHEHLARFKCPTTVDIVEALPRNTAAVGYHFGTKADLVRAIVRFATLRKQRRR